jgi:hypothetical protein
VTLVPSRHRTFGDMLIPTGHCQESGQDSTLYNIVKRALPSNAVTKRELHAISQMPKFEVMQYVPRR